MDSNSFVGLVIHYCSFELKTNHQSVKHQSKDIIFLLNILTILNILT